MYIKRNVYFSAIDQETGEERLFSVNEVLDEETYLERLYSEEKETKLKTSDKVNLWMNKHLATKGNREAALESIEEGKHGKLVKRSAAAAAVGAGLASGAKLKALGASNKQAAKGAAILGLAGAAGGAAGSYLGAKTRDVLKKHINSYDKSIKKQADLIRVANGDMTKEEFAKKHYKKD